MLKPVVEEYVPPVVPVLVKDHVATTMAQSTIGKITDEQLEQNPYANVFTNSRSLSEYETNYIQNENVSLVLNNATRDIEIMVDKAEIEEYRSSDTFRLAETSEEKTQMLAYATASGMLAAWATTSNDNNSNSLAIQQVAESHFGIQGAATWDYAETATEDNVQDTVNRYEDVIAANLDAQYNATQQWFQEQGISEVTLYRGMEIDTPAGTQEVQMRPLSSWTLEPDQASAFGQTIFQATFPVDRILSIPTTGVGCLREQEAVVLGGRISAEVSIDDVMGDVDMEDMFDAVQNQMK
jgi:hypothetical protein